MKLIVQSDDLGITEAVSCGIEKGIRDGVITCTGLFSNMPAAAFAVRLIRPYGHVCLGQDINLVAGRPCADPARIPSLVQEDGSFKTSGMHRAVDQADGNQEHVILRDCLIEVEAQIKRFIELTGKKPEYLHGHSYSTPAVWRAMEVMGETYGIPLVRDMLARYKVSRLSATWNKKPFSLEEQIKADPMACILGDPEFLSNQIGFIGTHCGYVDDALFDVSTYTMIRTRDLAAVTGEVMKQWIHENSIELISYRDLISQKEEGLDG
ncbi:MAG: ChbG/HpnK family deacetylase [Clostridium sp.]|nr:ChbG/HpnK family deacetylase [Clostridium sp.]